MLEEAHGNLLRADVQALVNTVNTVGVMGKGIALQFKRAFPDNFKKYVAACKVGEVETGRMFVYETFTLDGPSYIINFPTKTHWRAASKIEDVKSGLTDLRRVIIERDIRSIAIPPLGCGNGGLSWTDVRPLIEAALSDLPNVRILVFPPEGAPKASEMPIRTKRPSMTRLRAALLVALDRYLDTSIASGLSEDRTLSLLEVQKTAYFLQLAGWDSKWSFVKGRYGPYARELDQLASSIEGHLIHGFGDGSIGSRATIELDSSALAEAQETMRDDADFETTLARFGKIVEGFEYPYGIELLSTVHFVSADSQFRPNQLDLPSIVMAVKSWSRRKSRLFKDTHLAAAHQHLVEVAALGHEVARS